MNTFLSRRLLPIAAVVLSLPAVALAAPVDFDLPVQSLETSLKAVASIGGLNLVATRSLLTGKAAPALKGTYEPAEALRRLLTGSGLAVSVTDGNAVVIQQTGEIELEKVSVQSASNGLNSDGSTQESGGMYVAKQSFGPFGETSAQDLPFASTSIPKLLLDDQQPRYSVDVLKNDPSVQTFTNSGSTAESYKIRGFANQTYIRQDGLPLIMGSDPELTNLERVDVLKGATSVLFGFAAPDGVVNYVSKKPLDTPLNEVDVGYENNAQFTEHADVSHRFGPNDQFGMRLNAMTEDGQGPIDHQGIDHNSEALALDFKPTDDLTFWANLQHGYKRWNGGLQGFIFLAGSKSLGGPITSVPKPIDGSTLFGQPWATEDQETNMITTGVNWTPKDWDFHASFGQANESMSLANAVAGSGLAGVNANLQANENQNIYGYRGTYYYVETAYNASISHKFETGPLVHDLSIAADGNFYTFNYSNQATTGLLGVTNLYSPVYVSNPSFAANFPYAKSTTYLNSILSTDRISIGNHWSVIGGAVYNEYRNWSKSATSNSNPSAPFASPSDFHQGATTPLGAILFKPVPQVTTYASYIQALQNGTTVGGSYKNAGQILSPYISEQYETGVKTEVAPGLMVNTDVFRVSQAFAFGNSNGYYLQSGREVHEGLEVTTEGRVTSDLTVFGGIMWLLPSVTDEPGLITKTPTGVAKWKANMYAEYALPGIAPGLALMGGVYFTGDNYLTSGSNVLKVPNYTTVDLGAKYETALYGTPTTFRAYVNNALDARYWQMSNTLIVGQPQTFKVSVTAKF